MDTIATLTFMAIRGTETATKSTITIVNRGRYTDGSDTRTTGENGITLRQDDDLMSLGGGCTLTLPYGAEVEASCARADFVFLFAWCHCRAQRYALSSHCRYFGVELPVAPSTRCFCVHRLAKSGDERQCNNECHAEQFELMAEIRNSCSIFREFFMKHCTDPLNGG